jgi:N-acyl-D-amino-acid deacylase
MNARMALCSFLLLTLLVVPQAAAAAPAFDVLIRGGNILDGRGGTPFVADVGIRGDRIVAIGSLAGQDAATVIDAGALAVAPGFINMLSWSNESLIHDGRSQGGIRQGVTLEVLGEGTSMGPLNADMKRRLRAGQTLARYEVEWTTLAEYLRFLEKRGISTNVASFIGAATVRTHVLGLADVQPTPAQLEQMRELVRREMEEGALGIGTALIYAPGTYAKTEELIELCKVAARYKGKYTSHLRSEGSRISDAIDELVRISREAGIPAEIHHLKLAGAANWGKVEAVLAQINRARAQGLAITANMYLYPASSTGLAARIPSWAHDGGPESLFRRLEDAPTRAKIAREMRASSDTTRVVFTRFRKPELRSLIGKTLAEVAKARGKDEVDTILDLVLEDRSRIQAVFFIIDERNIARQLREPWVSLGSDGASMAPEGLFLEGSTHPRAYGNAARLLGKYVREDQVLTLPEAVRRLSGLPAANLGLEGRGFLEEGMYADVVVFDPKTVADKATFDEPHQYSIGVRHVLVNGVAVLRDGEHTGARPGRAVWGPGKVR